MSDHVYRDGDRVLLYGVEHLVDGTPTTLTVFLKTLEGLYVAADISLLTPVALPEPPKPAPQIGGEFVLQCGQRAFFGAYSVNVDAIIIDHLAGEDVYSEGFHRIESADGVVLWKRKNTETGT